jgi:hypothetical protein
MDKMVCRKLPDPSPFAVMLTPLPKQIQTGNGEVVITNDGATILKHMAVLHPAARMVR